MYWIVSQYVPYSISIDENRGKYHSKSYSFDTKEQAEFESMNKMILHYEKSLSWTQKEERPKMRKEIKKLKMKQNLLTDNYPEMLI